MYFDSYFIINFWVILYCVKKLLRNIELWLRNLWIINICMYLGMYLGDLIVCIMKDVVCKFYKEKF